LKYHFPFVLDLNYVHRIPRSHHKYSRAANTKSTLVDLLIDDLELQITQLKLNFEIETEVLTVLDFTTSSEAIQFMNSKEMRLLSGIDYHEAVWAEWIRRRSWVGPKVDHR